MPGLRRALAHAALFGALVANAAAGELACAGTVDQIAFHAPGRIMLRLGSMNVPVFICSTDSDWIVAGTGYTTTPAACKALYASFLAARTTGGTQHTVVFDGDQVPASCNAWPTWAHATIRYFAH